MTSASAGATASVVLAGAGPGQSVFDGTQHRVGAPLTAANWSDDVNGALSDFTSLSVVLESNDTIVPR